METESVSGCLRVGLEVGSDRTCTLRDLTGAKLDCGGGSTTQ